MKTFYYIYLIKILFSVFEKKDIEWREYFRVLPNDFHTNDEFFEIIQSNVYSPLSDQVHSISKVELNSLKSSMLATPNTNTNLQTWTKLVDVVLNNLNEIENQKTLLQDLRRI